MGRSIRGADGRLVVVSVVDDHPHLCLGVLAEFRESSLFAAGIAAATVNEFLALEGRRLLATVAVVGQASLMLSACNHTVVSVGAAVEPAGLPIRFAIMFAIQPDGGLEVGGSVGMVTELGVFSLEASVRTEMTPAANETLLIIRHYLRGQVVDSVFKIGTAEAVTVTAIGTIKIEVASQRVFIDASTGRVSSILVKNAPRPPSGRPEQLPSTQTQPGSTRAWQSLPARSYPSPQVGHGLVGYPGSAPPAAGSYTDTSIRPQAERVFLIGAQLHGRTQFSGELWLAFNDDAYSDYTTDNSGNVTATVRLVRP